MTLSLPSLLKATPVFVVACRRAGPMRGHIYVHQLCTSAIIILQMLETFQGHDSLRGYMCADCIICDMVILITYSAEAIKGLVWGPFGLTGFISCAQTKHFGLTNNILYHLWTSNCFCTHLVKDYIQGHQNDLLWLTMLCICLRSVSICHYWRMCWWSCIQNYCTMSFSYGDMHDLLAMFVVGSVP